MKQIALSLRKKSLKHAPDHYRLAAMKRVARRGAVSASDAQVVQNADSRQIAGFMPVGVKARVLSWPKL
ncbi:hypothetical protein [Diaphorobacter caeni]|uniref:hypothetical protein n=1 Tax=Diaphorobacter caeni TaxID=2784387 RepID=UPI00188F84E8|nr:hypothetical protein [Diaphorobacter caeni]MBF5006848.1 hypothetical protein [Diaphorobacter caeni]